MGIKHLNEFMRKNCPGVFEEIHISQYAFKKLAIDTSLFLCKYKCIMGDRWLTAFINLVACLRRNEIHCVFIYDTGCVQEKEEERAERRRQQEKTRQRVVELETAYEKYESTGEVGGILIELYDKIKNKSTPNRSFLRNKPSGNGINMDDVKQKIIKMRNNILSIDKDDFTLTKELFKTLNIPFYDAPLEAETMCSDLCKRGIVDAVLSEDTDVLAYGAPTFLTKIDTTLDTCVRINYDQVLEQLNISKEQFLDLCIMFGCDYNKNIPKVGPETSFKYIKTYGSLDEIENKLRIDTTILNYKRTRELFTKYEQYNLTEVPYCGVPDFKQLKTFVDESSLRISFEDLERYFTENDIIVFEEEK